MKKKNQYFLFQYLKQQNLTPVLEQDFYFKKKKHVQIQREKPRKIIAINKKHKLKTI